LNLLVVENALSLPMNVPLGIALAEFIGETSMRTIAHHHDFWWERTRYIKSPADDYLVSVAKGKKFFENKGLSAF